MSEIDSECGQRLMIFVVQVTGRFEIVELRSAPAHAGDTVTEFGRHAFHGPNYQRARAVVCVVRVIAIGQQRVVGWVIGSARSGIGDDR